MTIVSQVFSTLGKREAEAFNMPDLPMVIVPHPLAVYSDAELRQMGAGLVPGVLAALTGQEAK